MPIFCVITLGKMTRISIVLLVFLLFLTSVLLHGEGEVLVLNMFGFIYWISQPINATRGIFFNCSYKGIWIHCIYP